MLVYICYAAVLTQEQTFVIDGKTFKHEHPITYVSVLLWSSQLNWTTLTKEAYVIYMTVKKLFFYLADAPITLQSDNLLWTVSPEHCIEY